MLEQTPNTEDMIALIGNSLYEVWTRLIAEIDMYYDIESTWNPGGKKWTYEYKYRRGSKTLCCLYAKKDAIGFMIIFGKDEREKFENNRHNYSEIIQKTYDEAQTFHDGKWVMFKPVDTTLFNDFVKLLEIKRKPNIG